MAAIFKSQVINKLVLDKDFIDLIELLKKEEYIKNFTFKIHPYGDLIIDINSDLNTATNLINFIKYSPFNKPTSDGSIDKMIKITNQFLLAIYIVCQVWNLVYQHKLIYKGEELVFCASKFLAQENYLNENMLISGYSLPETFDISMNVESIKFNRLLILSFSVPAPDKINDYLQTIEYKCYPGNGQNRCSYIKKYNINSLNKNDILFGIDYVLNN